jgi:hypothetical protein
MTVHAVLLEKGGRKAVVVPLHGLAWRVDAVDRRSRDAGHGESRDCEDKCETTHANTSLRGPLPESYFAAICSLMLKRSQGTPAACRSEA